MTPTKQSRGGHGTFTQFLSVGCETVTLSHHRDKRIQITLTKELLRELSGLSWINHSSDSVSHEMQLLLDDSSVRTTHGVWSTQASKAHNAIYLLCLTLA